LSISAKFKFRLPLVFILLTIIIVITFNVLGTCLSFLPYGYNGFFVHLPKNEQFCVSSPDGNTIYRTDVRGARIISGKNVEVPVYAFGESQLLEIFPSAIGKKHALRSLYEKKTLIIHAAPNNGPFESVEYLKYVLRTTSAEKIVIGFNFGTDVFRIIPGWKTKKSVSLDSDQLTTVMMFPFWYEFKILIDTLRGEFFTYDRPDLARTRNYYMSQKKLIRKNFSAFTTLLKNVTEPKISKIDFIFFPPYWAYSQNGQSSHLEIDIENEFNSFVCDRNILNPLRGSQVYIAEFPKSLATKKLLTYDRRHFRTEFLTFRTKEAYCDER
jgi:hypothetical protein